MHIHAHAHLRTHIHMHAHTHACTQDMYVLHATMHMVTWFSMSLSFSPSIALQHKCINVLFTGTRSTRLHTRISYIHSLSLSSTHKCMYDMNALHASMHACQQKWTLSLSRSLSFSQFRPLSFMHTRTHGHILNGLSSDRLSC